MISEVVGYAASRATSGAVESISRRAAWYAAGGVVLLFGLFFAVLPPGELFLFCFTSGYFNVEAGNFFLLLDTGAFEFLFSGKSGFLIADDAADLQRLSACRGAAGRLSQRPHCC